MLARCSNWVVNRNFLGLLVRDGFRLWGGGGGGGEGAGRFF